MIPDITAQTTGLHPIKLCYHGISQPYRDYCQYQRAENKDNTEAALLSCSPYEHLSSTLHEIYHDAAYMACI